DLEATGLSAEVAARRAVAELGDIRSIVDELETSTAPRPPWVRHRVRPKPGYVVRTVVLSTVGVVALGALVVPAFGLSVALAWQVAAVLVVALVAGVIVADALRQETTTNYPVPFGRAAGYGGSTVL